MAGLAERLEGSIDTEAGLRCGEVSVGHTRCAIVGIGAFQAGTVAGQT